MFWTATISDNSFDIKDMSKGEKIIITRWVLNADAKGKIDLFVENESKPILISKLERGRLEEAKINLQFTKQHKLLKRGNGSVSLYGFKHTDDEIQDIQHSDKITVAQMLAQTKLTQDQQKSKEVKQSVEQETKTVKPKQIVQKLEVIEEKPVQSKHSQKVEKAAQKSDHTKEKHSILDDQLNQPQSKQEKSVFYRDEQDWFGEDQLASKKVKL